MLGAALLYPAEDRLQPLVPAAAELERAGEAFAGLAFFPDCRRFLRLLGGGQADTVALQADYLEIFGAGRGLVPQESAFLAPGSPGLTMVAVEAAYAEAGLAMAGAAGEPPDHGAVELEFVGLLCGEEARAWARRSVGEALRRLEQEADFLGRHLGRWMPLLAREVGLRAAGSFYASATRAAESLIEHDRGLLPALLARYRESGGR